MSIITRTADLFYTFRFLKILTTPFEKTDAFKLGIIDNKGKRDKKVLVDDDKKKKAYTAFHRLVFNVKRLMASVGAGGKIASYTAALFLLKEKLNLSDKQIEKVLQQNNIDPLDILKESTEWFLLEDNSISPGIYRVKSGKMLNMNFEEMVQPNDKVRIGEDCFPTGNILGIDVYKAIHVPTNQEIYVVPTELRR